MSGRLLVRFAFACRILLALILSAPIVMKSASRAEARGPLRSNPANPRYFVDSLGNPVYLAGSYQNPYNLLSGVSDIASYFDFLAQQNQNFTRLWAWEQSPWTYDQNGNITFTLQPYERTGPGAALDGGLKFDLTRFNQAYFDQLRSRIIAAGQRRIYVSLILFEGFSTQRKVRQVDPWLADPFHGGNNVNGINADENSDGRATEFFSLESPSLTALQEAFVRKIVDTLEDLDNVLYEISGDTLPSSLGWQFHMLDYLKSYQATKINQHPVGISQFYGKSLSDVLGSSADWVVIQGSKAIPALATGSKILFREGNAATSKQPAQWVWQSFVRGYNPIHSESDGGTVSSEIHAAIGQTKAYAALLDMATMTPSDTACSNRLCLVNSRSQYLTYLPSGGSVTLDLSNSTGNLAAAWFDPTTGQTISENTTLGGQRVRISSPARGPSVLQVTGNRAILSKQERTTAASTSTSLLSSSATTNEDVVYASRFALQESAVATPTITPNGGIYSGSVKVTLQTSTPGAAIYYTTDGQTPTTSSQRYKNAFTLSSSTLVKAIAFKNNTPPSGQASAWFSNSASSSSIFDYSLSISGDVTVTAGASGSTNFNATLNSGSAEPVSFAVSGLPSGATANLSAPSCNPSCSSALTIDTTSSTSTGNFPVTVTATAGGLKKAAAFALTVAAPSAVSAPVITPNGGSFSTSVSVTMSTSTFGASIYYTTNGSSPTQSSTPYTAPITLTNSAIIKAKAFNSGYNPSAEVSASFTKLTTNIGTPSLVAHWKFDEGTGTTSVDSSGNGNAGTLINGPKWVSGVAGNALSFDGTDDSVDVANSNSLNLTNIFTFSAWVNPAVPFTDFRSILVKNYKYYLYSSVAGYCGNGSPLGGFAETTNNTVCDPAPLPINTWTHLTLTSDGSTLTLFQNGFAIATTPATETLLPSPGNLQIGASQFGEYFQGLIDEIQIYNKALSGAEIQAVYRQIAVNLPFDYAVSTSGNKSVTAGSSITNTIITSLVSGVPQAVSFSVSGLPSGAAASFSPASCTPNCSTILTITSIGSTPAGNYPITVTAAGGGLKKSTVFTLSVTFALTVATPTITPNGGNFTGSVSVTMNSVTSGNSIYFTTDGTIPTESSHPYTDVITLMGNATVKAAAFKRGYNPSAVATAMFTNSITNATSTGTTYYVATNGSDSNPGTASQPFSTIKKGVSVLKAGDVVYIRSGTYYENLDSNRHVIPSGTSWGNPVTIAAYPGEIVTMAFASPTENGLINLATNSLNPTLQYIIFDGIIFDGSNVINGMSTVGVGFGANTPANHIRFINVEVKNTGAARLDLPVGAGFIVNGSFNEFINCKSHDNGLKPNVTPPQAPYGFYIMGTDHLIEKCKIYNNGGYGIHVYNSDAGGSHRQTIRYNDIYNNGVTAGNGTAGIVVTSGVGHFVHNNIVRGNFDGIQVTGPFARVYNNTVYGNRSWGIVVHSTGNIIRNNIIHNNATIGNGSQNIYDFGSGNTISNNLIADPKFIDPSGADLHLQSYSAAIDAGADLSSEGILQDYDGFPRLSGYYDIGAFEYR